jgi:hypothetical protein
VTILVIQKHPLPHERIPRPPGWKPKQPRVQLKGEEEEEQDGCRKEEAPVAAAAAAEAGAAAVAGVGSEWEGRGFRIDRQLSKK